MKAISLTPSISADSVDLLLDSFNSTVENVIDDISPVKVSRRTAIGGGGGGGGGGTAHPDQSQSILSDL